MAEIQLSLAWKKTTNPRRMIPNGLFSESIIGANASNLPTQTATSIRYKKGSTTAIAWDEGGNEVPLFLPLNDDWYRPDGNFFGIPNGSLSSKNDPGALYLSRYQNADYEGPLWRGLQPGYYGRDVNCFNWSDSAGLSLFVETPPAAPIILGKPSDPAVLLERASQLEDAVTRLRQTMLDTLPNEIYGWAIRPDVYHFMVRPVLREIDRLREAAKGH